MRKPHVAVVGAGPTGLDAALALADAGFGFRVYEASAVPAGHLVAWAHVQLFTPWELDVSPRMRARLAALGRQTPSGERPPTGAELFERVLAPVAASLDGALRLGTRVVAIGREGLLKHEEIASSTRASQPLRLLLRDEDGRESVAHADAVLDCSGAGLANSIGDGGIPAPGELALERSVLRAIPDLERDAQQFAGGTVLLVGSGHSAQTALRDLSELAERNGMRVVWVRRSIEPLAALEQDRLPHRHALTSAAAALESAPPAWLEVHRGCVVDALEPGSHIGVALRHRDGSRSELVVDSILALTGRVGDHRLYRQLQIHECYATCGPMKLAAALLGGSGGGGDCLDQASLGAEALRNPEPGFFILGAKSYGRRSDYLMQVGWQQVDEVLSLLG